MFVVDPGLGMDGPLYQPQSSRGCANDCNDLILEATIEPRWGHQDRLLEIRAIHRVGLVEQGQHLQVPVDN